MEKNCSKTWYLNVQKVKIKKLGNIFVVSKKTIFISLFYFWKRTKISEFKSLCLWNIIWTTIYGKELLSNNCISSVFWSRCFKLQKSFLIIFNGDLFNEREYSSWTLKLKSYFNYLNECGIFQCHTTWVSGIWTSLRRLKAVA